jgi:hypothetical protein
MNMLDQLRHTFREHFGIKIENRSIPRPDITAVEGAVAIGRTFDADCERQKLQHQIDIRGLPRPHIATNDQSLGLQSPLRTIIDWLN